jgi:hypothetical protein
MRNSGLPSQINVLQVHLCDLVIISTFEATKAERKGPNDS